MSDWKCTSNNFIILHPPSPERDINFALLNEVPKETPETIVKPHLFCVYLVLLLNAVGYFVVYLLLKNVDSRDSLHRTVDKLVRYWSGTRCGLLMIINHFTPPDTSLLQFSHQ